MRIYKDVEEGNVYRDTLYNLRWFAQQYGVTRIKADIKDLDLNFYDELFGHGMKPIKIVPAVLR